MPNEVHTDDIFAGLVNLANARGARGSVTTVLVVAGSAFKGRPR